MLAVFSAVCIPYRLSACTTLVVTKGASADGSMYVAHSDDNDLTDESIVYIPAKKHAEGAVRSVYASVGAGGSIPALNISAARRLVAPERAPGYTFPGLPASVPLGTIPEVPSTYAYIEGIYGCLNEKGLLFGECTDMAKIFKGAEKGHHYFYSAELAAVALERCTSAREAVLLMGSLIDTYGYYGTGETLPVADKDEAWVMEMAPAPDGGNGFWAAQRIPDGEIFVAANEFRIREIAADNPDQIVTEKTIDGLKACGWAVYGIDGKTVDWLRSTSNGEFRHPYYSLRRVWRAMSLAAPSRNFPAAVEDGFTRAYPFSVKPDRKITLADIMKLYRDHYEGTPYDMTKGPASGPFGCPYRYMGAGEGNSSFSSGRVSGKERIAEGAWERPVGCGYTGYTVICQNRSDGVQPLVWIALNTAAESVFVPFTVSPLPESYERFDRTAYDESKAWWIYNRTGEFANTKYSWIIKDIRAHALDLENASQKLVASYKDRKAGELSKALMKNASLTMKDWNDFYGKLRVKYNQGFVDFTDVGYPAEWLKTTEYTDGPVQY
jgi:dipeptidase